MKVTMLSKADYAGSGYKMWEAISTHTDIDIDLFSLHGGGKYGHPRRNRVKKGNIALQERVNSSDVIHIKGDWPLHNNYMGLKIMHKPVVQTVGGSLFRKNHHGGIERWAMNFFEPASLNTASTPDLLYSDYGNIWTPHPIDCDDVPRSWKRSDPVIFVHSPTNTSKKGTKFILAVFEAMKGRVDFETRIIPKVSFKEILKLRSESTIFFDQFKVGFYGNSAIESMQYGVPTCAWISPEAFEQSNGALENCPVLTLPVRKVSHWAEMLTKVVNSDMDELSKDTKEWCDQVHGYKAIALQWEKLYQAVI